MAIVHGYCSLEEVKFELRIAPSDEGEDAQIEREIERASRALDSWTGWWFYARAETRVYTARSGVRLVEPSMGLLSVTTLSTDEDGDRVHEVTWDAARDYYLGPLNAAADGEPYWQIEADAVNGRYRFPVGVRGGVQIVGAFGYSAAPPDNIRQACLRLAVESYRQRDRRPELGEPAGLPMLSMDMRALLWPYKRAQGVG